MGRGNFVFVNTPDPVYLEEEEDAEEYVERYMSAAMVGFDTETTGLNKTTARVKFFSFADNETRICAPVRLLDMFGPILEDPAIVKCLSNWKFDQHMVSNHGWSIRGEVYDTVDMDWLEDENRMRHGLKWSAKHHLGLRMIPFKEVFGAVGSIDKEVEMLCRIHDVLEDRDEDEARVILAILGRSSDSQEVSKALKVVSAAIDSGTPLTASKLLSIARKNGIAPKTYGKKSFVQDFCALLGKRIEKEDRESYEWMMEDEASIAHAHEIIKTTITSRSSDKDPLDLLRILVGDYASLDAWASYTLAVHLMPLLESEPCFDPFSGPSAGNRIDGEWEPIRTLLDHYEDTTDPFTRVLWNMERRGFLLDMQEVASLKAPWQKELDKAHTALVRLAGWGINPKSVDDKRKYFFRETSGGDWVDLYGNPPTVWTSGGQSGVKKPSTNKDVIAEFAGRGEPFAVALRGYTELTTLMSLSINKLPKHVDHRGRIHSTLKSTGAVTGRISSADPNLMNVPARGERGKRIRRCFVAGTWGDCIDVCMPEVSHIEVLPAVKPDTEMILLVADYDQVEMKLLSHFSQDRDMIDTILSGKDLHSRTAAMAGGYDYDEIVAAKKADSPTKDQEALLTVRSNFKGVGFGIMYGRGAVALGMELGMTILDRKARNGKVWPYCPEAEDLIREFFQVYPGVKRFIDNTHDRCAETLEVRTLRGRPRRLPDAISSERWIAARTKRQSVNSIIQGSAADIIIRAMLRCARDEDLRELGVRMLMQIHDELVFEVPNIPSHIEAAKVIVRELMEDSSLSVPITVSMDVAHRWGDAK